jgi:DNA-binding CsgD family transcriptional regulator/DNA-binding MarR family transcriptional regulator
MHQAAASRSLDAAAMLTALGASDPEDRSYQYLATIDSATSAEICGATGLTEAQTRAALDGLVQRGLVSQTSDESPRYVASSPGTVDAMIANRLVELRKAQEALDSLANKRRTGRLAPEAAGAIELITGAQALRHHALHLIRTARIEVIGMMKPPTLAVQSSERVMPAESVANRAIFETGALESPGALDAIRAGLRGGGDEVRVHSKVPLKMLGADRSVALIPLSLRDSAPASLLVYQSPVLDAILALFEYVWDSSVRLDLINGRADHRPDSTLSPEDRQLLSLLLAGLTDEAIAAHFRVSVRTVQRKVHALMEVANVRTRMQLAWEAARQDWLSPSGSAP